MTDGDGMQRRWSDARELGVPRASAWSQSRQAGRQVPLSVDPEEEGSGRF